MYPVDIVSRAAQFVCLPPKILFTLAYFYVEAPRTRGTCENEYIRWTKTGAYSVALEQMALDILAGRVQVLKDMPAVLEYRKSIVKLEKAT